MWKLFILGLFLVTATRAVSPVVNRELETSVVAHNWPSTPQNVLCEAFAYHTDGQEEFLAALDGPAESYEEAMALALRATPLEGTSKLLLQTALTMRAHSPHCEMHRTLARETLLQQGLLHRVKDAFVVVGGKVLVENLDDIPYHALLKASTEKTSGLLPQESKLFGDGRAVILYANLGSAAFHRLFKKFQKEKIPLVVRHLGVVDFEEDNSKATGTVLQGYGVRLDIRNVEYKVFDDRNTADDQEKEQDVDLNAVDLDTPGHFLAGVNITHLGYDRDLLKKVWLVHEQEQLQSSIIPPVWRRRQLPLQAATAILQGSQDALITLQQISQDLPSLASTLVHLQVPEEILEAANSVQEQRVRAGALLVNGLGMAVDSPSFNVFEVLNRLKEEQAALDNLQTRLRDLLPSYAALEDVQHAWAGGKAFLEDAGDGDDIDPTAVIKSSIRIDVARGWKKGGVLYLNDVEKDAQYAAWPTSTQQMIMGMQMGGPPTIRRNMFNVLAVMDPIADSQNAGLNLALQLMQSQYPARLGLLLVDKDHLRDCAVFLASEKNLDDDTGCPVKPMVDIRTKVDELEIVPVSTQAVQRLIVLAQRDMQKQGNLPTYFEYILGSIRQAQGSGIMYSLKDLLEMHGRLYEGLHIMDANEARAAGLKSLLLEDKDEDYLVYGRGLRFAVERGLKPGMSFLNGRPLPIDIMDESMNRIFGEEQNHIVQLIMKGEITDRSPRSIYGFLLKGDNVYQKSHPLLGDNDEGDLYADLKGSPGTEALRAISTDTSKPDAVFVVDGVFDLETPTGISLASKFVSIMEDFKPSPSLGENKIAISYRILPSSKPAAASAICPLLIHSSVLDSSHMTSIFQFWNSEMTLESILAKINISREARAAVTSDQAEAWCSSYKSVLPDGNAVLANGRILPLEDDSLTHDDIELLLSVEMKRSIAVTKLLAPHLDWKGPSAVSTVAQVATFLSFESESKTRGTVDSVLEDTGALRLKYDSSAEDRNTLVPFVTAVIDPVSEGAQRIAPILLMIRDRLKLPVEILLAPPAVLAGDSKSAPLTSYYRFVMDLDSFSATHKPRAYFSNLPSNHVLTLRTDVPEPWNVQQTAAVQDSDNLRCDINSGCGDETGDPEVSFKDQSHLTRVEYGLKNLLIFGQCYEATGAPPNGLQLTIMRHTEREVDDQSEGGDVEVEMDGGISQSSPTKLDLDFGRLDYSDSLVMKTVGYWQLRANPGVWKLSIAEESQGADMFDMVEGSARSGQLVVDKTSVPKPSKMLVMKDFVTRSELLVVQRKPGVSPQASIIGEEIRDALHDDDETVHVFSLATGHLYERFLKIMMLSVTKRTSAPVKFWLFENFLSPTFKASAKFMAKRIGCEVEFVTYKWPQWLRGQSEKQRIIWGYKILFLDVLFPLNVKKIIYVDADQVVRGDLKELWDMDLQGAPYGYTPFCSSREETLGYQFWREGFWKTHLRGKPYHISALYVVDLEKFRTHLVGDTLRSIYQQLSADPGSLSNLDQDLPNYAQHSVPIFSLPQEWLWCESWCSDQSKAAAKTIDLCNNPMHKEPKVSMAKRVISGELFEESWVELDAEVERYDQDFQVSAIAS